MDHAIADDPGWKLFFQLFHKSRGVSIDRKIWDFRIPTHPGASAENTGQFCLTDNYADFEDEQAIFKRNENVPAVYSYTREPDVSPDTVQKAGFERSISNGKLTDRRAAAAPSVEIRPEEHIVQWENADGLEITFKFETNVIVRSIRFFFSGHCPSIAIYGGIHSFDREIIGKAVGRDVGEDVGEIEVVTQTGEAGSVVTIGFEEDESPLPLTISEIEVWGVREIEKQ
jgi:hypothetical protein